MDASPPKAPLLSFSKSSFRSSISSVYVKSSLAIASLIILYSCFGITEFKALKKIAKPETPSYRYVPRGLISHAQSSSLPIKLTPIQLTSDLSELNIAVCIKLSASFNTAFRITLLSFWQDGKHKEWTSILLSSTPISLTFERMISINICCFFISSSHRPCILSCKWHKLVFSK